MYVHQPIRQRSSHPRGHLSGLKVGWVAVLTRELSLSKIANYLFVVGRKLRIELRVANRRLLMLNRRLRLFFDGFLLSLGVLPDEGLVSKECGLFSNARIVGEFLAECPAEPHIALLLTLN